MLTARVLSLELARTQGTRLAAPNAGARRNCIRCKSHGKHKIIKPAAVELNATS